MTDTKKLSAIAATAMAGIATGCLTFVSAVDVRSFLQHVSDDDHKKSVDLIQKHFPVWWPNGRDLMVPVIFGSVSTNLLAWWSTSDVRFAVTAGMVGLIGPYTAIVLGEDIENLRKSNPVEVVETTRRFCRLHHVRLVAAATGFALALTALADF